MIRHLACAVFVATLVLASGGAPVRAEDPPQGAAAGRLPVRIVGNRLVVRCDASYMDKRIPLNLMVDLESQAGLQLHRQAAGPGGLDLAGGIDGGFKLVTLHFPGFELETVNPTGGDERDWENFTRLYSQDLGETAVAGLVGAQVLERFHITLDLNAGVLVLGPRREGAQERPRAEPGEVVVPITVTRRVAWLPVTLEDGRQVAMGVGTHFHDTLLDQGLAADLGAPSGEIGAVRLGGLDLAAFVPFRPAKIRVATDDPPGFLTGLNLLRHLRIEIDRVNRWARIAVTAAPDFPHDDLEFYRALAAATPEALVAFLDANPETRLAPEAAERLLGLRVEAGADDEALAQALDWTLRTRPEDLRATVALELAKDLHEQGRDDVAVGAAKAGIKAGKKDRDPNAVHHLHRVVGEILLARGERHEAWRHLLSAAFGIPEDGRVNLGLARVYEQEGRLRRSLSRYLQAAIQADGGAEALVGLERVQKALGGDTLGVDEIERLVEGKIQTYVAATKFAPGPDEVTNRTVLVEFFTHPNLERVGLAGELAFEGSLTYYGREHAAMITYHLGGETPTTSAVADHEARFYGIGQPGVNVIDGIRTTDGAGRMRDREQLMQDLKAAVGEQLRVVATHTLTAQCQVVDGHVRGVVRASGPVHANAVLHVILIEKGVVFPGKSKIVIHRNLARAALTPTVEGLPFTPDEDGTMEFAFDRALADVTAEIETHLDELEAHGAPVAPRVSTRIDPEQVAVVAFLRDERTTAVLQAVHAEPPDGRDTAAEDDE